MAVRAIWLKHLPLDWLPGWAYVMCLAGSTSFLLDLSMYASLKLANSVTLPLWFTFTWIVWILETNQNIVEVLACKRPEKSSQRSEGSPYPLCCLEPKSNSILCNRADTWGWAGSSLHKLVWQWRQMGAKISAVLCMLSYTPGMGLHLLFLIHTKLSYTLLWDLSHKLTSRWETGPFVFSHTLPLTVRHTTIQYTLSGNHFKVPLLRLQLGR